MQQVDPTNTSRSDRVRRRLFRVAVAGSVALLMMGAWFIWMNLHEGLDNVIGVATRVGIAALGWFVFWTVLSWVVREFMKD